MPGDDELADGTPEAGDAGTPDVAAAVPGRRRLSPGAALAVAATVAGAAGLGVWLSAGGDRLADERAEPITSSGAPAGTVPSVFAHTRESATELLEGKGLLVQHRNEISCDPEGRPIGTDPSTGTAAEPGETVTLLVAHQGPLTDCSADLSEPWRFVDFVTGRGPAPQFADEVRLFIDGKPTKTLSGSQASGRGDWGDTSALGALRDAASEVLRLHDDFRTPTLEVHAGTPPAAVCGIGRPALLGSREALTITIDIPVVTQTGCPTRVALYRTSGEIDAVVAWTERPLSSASGPRQVPAVVGMSLARARDAVTAAGFTAQVEQSETCDPHRGVVEQAPTQQAIDEDFADDPDWSRTVTLVIEIPHSTRDCAALDAAAAAFVRFARGGPPPPWAPQVQQLFGHSLWDRITTERANDPAAWSYCSDVASTECDLSALVVAGGGQIETGEWSESNECEMVDYGGLPSGLNPEDHIVVFPASPPGCASDWSVELWIDEVGRISAVNLLLAEAVVANGG